MRPPSVDANPTCPAGCPCDLLALLQGPHRVALRLVMILLSHHGLPAATIAGLLGCDPATVRRWIQRYNTHGTDGLVDGHGGPARRGSPRLGQRIRRLLTQPRRGRSAGCGPSSADPPSASARCADVRQVAAWRRPRLVAKGDPDRDQILGELHQQLRELPDGAVVVAEDETHISLLPGSEPPGSPTAAASRS
jgi:Helix-turn-helix domain